MTANEQVQSPRGSRNTKQRAVVLDAVRSLHNHPTSADIYDFRCDNHFHAKCSRCGGVFDIETEGVDPLARIVNDYGFKVTGFDLAFSGVCPDCRDKNGE